VTDSPARRTTRDAIWDSASELFAQGGYAGTSVRDIASAAGIDPALVIRHFGSKESLFIETMTVQLDQQPLVDGPIDELGERFIRFVIDADDQIRGVYLALLRASDVGGINSALREMHDKAFVAPLRDRLTGDDIETRARLAASLVGGLLYALWVVGDDVLAADPDHIVTRYGALLQGLITPSN
jgi:AcrR family transcriptional regulator